MRRVCHANFILGLLRQREKAWYVSDQIIHVSSGHGRVLEIEESHVDQRVLQLRDELGLACGIRDQGIVKYRNAREVGCHWRRWGSWLEQKGGLSITDEVIRIIEQE